MGKLRPTYRKKRLISELQRSILLQGQREDKQVYPQGLFVRDPQNNHYILYKWNDLPTTQLENIWGSRQSVDTGLSLSFVIYKENGRFKPTCGLKIKDPEWNLFYGFTKTGEMVPKSEFFEDHLRPRARIRKEMY